MEFHEKLQQLRKQNNLTQEQLARRLYVSRTAVSKWESGRGYPNLESLKCISKLFNISIDELLSGGELIELAEKEKRSGINRLSAFMFGAVDLMTLVLVFMPLFGMREGEYFRAVTLLEHTELNNLLRTAFFSALIIIPVAGLAEIGLELLEKERGGKALEIISLFMHAAAILLFINSRQPYITTFLFLFFVVKLMLPVIMKKI